MVQHALVCPFCGQPQPETDKGKVYWCLDCIKEINRELDEIDRIDDEDSAPSGEIPAAGRD